ncbi:hypothetical protein Y032_0927g3073 [Ancylostoma ceylanicum]|nr:hypothetical protein Y032_0927g3073 [Ancylostoma ceylanicum]
MKTYQQRNKNCCRGHAGLRVSPDFAGGRGDRQFEMNQNEPAIEEIRVVEMIRIDCHVDRLERCQTELIAGTLEDVPTMKWRWE